MFRSKQQRAGRPYIAHMATFLALTVGSVWALTLFYLANYEFAVMTLGTLSLTNPVVVVILNSPAIATVVILLSYDGPRGLLNFFLTLIPRRRDLLWLPALAAAMLVYVLAVHFACMAAGIPVPPEPMSPSEMFSSFLGLFFGEAGMLAIAMGWFGFFLPAMHRLTKSHLWSGVATGLGIGLFAAPGNLFSSFDLATAWPLYTLQLIILSIAMSHLLTRMKGNVLFFLVPFWVSASGSMWRMYYFTASTQLIQIALFTPMVVILCTVLSRQDRKASREPHSFPEYLENTYTTQTGAVISGKGDRSLDSHVAPAPKITLDTVLDGVS